MFKIKTAQKDDLPLLQKLAREIWIAHYTAILSTDQIEYMLNLMYSESTIEQEINCGVIWKLITTDEIPVGFISYSPSESDLKLNKLYILPGYHGQGFGQTAITHVIDYAARHNIPKVYLTVNKKNYKAIKAYEKAGFLCTSSEVTDIGNGFVMDDFIYTRFL